MSRPGGIQTVNTIISCYILHKTSLTSVTVIPCPFGVRGDTRPTLKFPANHEKPLLELWRWGPFLRRNMASGTQKIFGELLDTFGSSHQRSPGPELKSFTFPENQHLRTTPSELPVPTLVLAPIPSRIPGSPQTDFFHNGMLARFRCSDWLRRDGALLESKLSAASRLTG